MAQQYTIKAGDTLGKVAKKFGTNVSNISGFRSGNADLIFPGETVTINTPKVSEATTRASEVRSTLAPETITKDTNATDTTSTDVNFNKFQKELEDSNKKREDAFNQLKGFRTNRYEELRKERGLEDFRNSIDTLDQEIAQKKSERDAALAKVKKNPGASAATITGEVAGVTDQLNAEINNLIEQRNSKANSYNSTLSEIDKIVSNEAGDLESQLGYYDSLVNNASSALSDYNKAVLEELRRTEDRQNTVADNLQEFQNALEIARIRGAGSDTGTTFQLKFDPITGESFLFNPDTGKVVSPEKADVNQQDVQEVNQSLLPDTQAGTQKTDSGGGFLQGLKNFFTGG